MRKLRKGDSVIVLTGKDRGKTGTVTQVMPEVDRILIEGVNLVKKHQKPNPNAGVAGGIVSMEKPLHASNVALVNPATGKADRVGFRVLEDGRKVRFFKSNGEVVDA